MAKPSKEQRLEALALFSAVNSGVRVAQKLNITYELLKDWLLRFKFDHTDWREENSKYFFNEEKLRLMNLYFATMPGRRKFAAKYNTPDTLFKPWFLSCERYGNPEKAFAVHHPRSWQISPAAAWIIKSLVDNSEKTSLEAAERVGVSQRTINRWIRR